MPPKKTPRYKPTAEMKVKKVRVIKNRPDAAAAAPPKKKTAPPKKRPAKKNAQEEAMDALFEESKKAPIPPPLNHTPRSTKNLKDFGFEELTKINKRFSKHENTRFLYDRLDSWKKEHKKALRDSFTSAATSREKDILARVEKFINVYENSKHKAT